MPLQKPGETPSKLGEYVERGPRGGQVPIHAKSPLRKVTGRCRPPRSRAALGNESGRARGGGSRGRPEVARLEGDL